MVVLLIWANSNKMMNTHSNSNVCNPSKRLTYQNFNQPTVLKRCPMATKQKETVLMVEDEINSMLSMDGTLLDLVGNCNYNSITVESNDTDDLSAKSIEATLNTLDN
jgi:hypothetical protein